MTPVEALTLMGNTPIIEIFKMIGAGIFIFCFCCWVVS